MDEIVNKVANRALEVFDLEEFYPKENRSEIDISQWLLEGFLLKEKEFRAQLNQYNWAQYQGQNVAVFCSTDPLFRLGQLF